MSFIFLFVFLLTFTLTNIALGCWGAILLGYGPPNTKAAAKLVLNQAFDPKTWNFLRLPNNHRLSFLLSFFKSLPFLKRQAQVDAKPDATEPQPTTEPVQPDAAAKAPATPTAPQGPQTINDLITSINATSLNDLIVDEADDLTSLTPMQELFDDELAKVLMEQGPEAWLVNEKNVETSILKLNVAMMKSGRFTAELDSRLRRVRGSGTPVIIKQFKTELSEDCQNYLVSQKSVLEQIQNRLNEFGELKSLAEDIDIANLEQEAQIETTISNLNQLQPENPEEAITRLLRELVSLRVARHRLRDMQEKAFMKVVTYENRVDTIPPQSFINDILGIRGRIGIESTLFEWWKQKRHQTRQLAFALLDIVECGKLNDEYGIAPCDRLLTFLGKSLEIRFDPLDLVGMYTGNCFLVATTNSGVKKTLTEIDRFRQYCEKGTFLFNDKEGRFKCNLTCAVIEAAPTDNSHSDVLKKLEGVLSTAKKAGRNQTFWIEPGGLTKPPVNASVPELGEKPHETDIELEPKLNAET